MSIQLIIYPQKYEGFTTTGFNLPVEMLANGNNFVNVGDYVSSYPAPSSTLSQQAVTALFPPTFFYRPAAIFFFVKNNRETWTQISMRKPGGWCCPLST